MTERGDKVQDQMISQEDLRTKVVSDVSDSDEVSATVNVLSKTEWQVLIIIPAFNEAQSLGTLLEEVKRCCPWAAILVINDGSTDATSREARLAQVPVADLPVNLGIGGAVQTGLRYADRFGYNLCLQLDGDGQHNPANIQFLLKAMDTQSADAVVGSRFVTNGGYQSTRTRRIGIWCLRWLIKLLSGKTVTDPTSGFRVFGKRAIRFLANDYPQEYPEPEVIFKLLCEKMEVVEVPVEMRKRHAGKSSISGLHSALYMLQVSLAILIDSIRLPCVLRRAKQ